MDDLLDKTESGRDQSLRCDELDGASVKPMIERGDHFTVARIAKTNTILSISEVRDRAPIKKFELTSIMVHLQVPVSSCRIHLEVQLVHHESDEHLDRGTRVSKLDKQIYRKKAKSKTQIRLNHHQWSNYTPE